MNRPMEVLKKMIAAVKKNGLVVCVDVNREFENDGLYIDDINYDYLCTAFDFHKLWKKELECTECRKSFIKVHGLMITYGRK